LTNKKKYAIFATQKGEIEMTKAYKGFDFNWKCRDFQYEVGKIYETKDNIEVCEKGFHCCKNPIDVFNYYNDVKGKYAEVEILGEEKKKEDKTVTSKIKIVKELSFWDIFKLNIAVVVDVCLKSSKKSTSGHDSHANTSGHNSHANTSGDRSHANTSGYRSHANTSGYRSHANTSGHNSHANTSGDRSHANTSGYRSHANTSGYRSHANTSGHNSHANTSGDRSHANTSGYRSHANTSGYRSHANTSGHNSHANTSGHNSHANTSGYRSHANTSGDNSIACALGILSKAKSLKGWIILVEYDNEYKIKNIRSGKVGVDIKSDIWYELKDNKFVEVK
jgi:hypothetical protein